MSAVRILVVEDEAIVAMDVMERLQGLGYTPVGHASQGDQALRMIDQLGADLVLMDIHIQGDRDGIETAEIIGERFDLPVVFLTAFAEDATLERATLVEPYAFIVKPFDDRDLKGAIEIAVHKHRIAKALKASEHRYRTLVDASPAAIRVVQGDVCVFANDQAARVYGVDRADRMIGWPSMGGVADEDLPVMVAHLAAAGAGHPNPPVELRIRTAGGVDRWCESTCVSIVFNGEPATLVIENDITARKQAEADRDRLQAQLLQSQKMESVGRLAGGVAHDFNNMLGVILGHVELAMMQVEPASPLQRDLDEIRSAASRSAELTKQLLAFARKQTVAPKVLDLNDTVVGMLRMLRRLIGEDIDLVWKPGAGLWRVRIDPTQVDQILANLAVNAKDAIGGQGAITLETENARVKGNLTGRRTEVAPGDYVLLRFTDTGSGMDPRTIDHLFEPFFTTKAVGKGTGLGLATVYGIVKQNDGYIDVDSTPGMGTTFRIYLRRVEQDPVHAGHPAGATLAEGHETVLMVEDEPAILSLGRDILGRQGYRVLTARSPSDAIALAHAHAGNIDLVVADVVMPGMNGKVLVDQLTAARPGLRCLFMSGYTSDAIAERGVLDGGSHFIQKPFSLRSLTEKVRQVLDA